MEEYLLKIEEILNEASGSLPPSEYIQFLSEVEDDARIRRQAAEQDEENEQNES